MDLLKERLTTALSKHPMLSDYLKYKNFNNDLTIESYIKSFSNDELEELGTNSEKLREDILSIMRRLDQESKLQVDTITIKGGRFKDDTPETIDIVLRKGSITSIVGPTGSGKSRLLADIEWMAQQDTPTKRQILINHKAPNKKLRFSFEHKLVAQLSQNMNFVIDASVEEFIRMHIESRNLINTELLTEEIIVQANLLAGESFKGSSPITSLSGGQSRALMIADTAFLSTSPIILIDEIENAGIDRKKALDLLVRKEKIILIATHDPILALLADQRIVIKNGGIIRIINTSEEEKKNLMILEEIDAQFMNLRHQLRNGLEIKNIDFKN